jgi:hypothetical protein
LLAAVVTLMMGLVDVVAQWVRTSWTKRSRGGPAAARRNAAPVGFALPAIVTPSVHEVAMDELQDFEPQVALCAGVPDRTGVQLNEVDGKLRVKLVVTPFGMHARHTQLLWAT